MPFSPAAGFETCRIPIPSEPVREAIDAYTINGARMLNLQQQAGSIEPGKSADFIVLNQDILALADDGHPERIADTHALATWFQGQKVYTEK
jgi:predicted amidohydrolase YtcJ